jgi:hypothetical protein
LEEWPVVGEPVRLREPTARLIGRHDRCSDRQKPQPLLKNRPEAASTLPPPADLPIGAMEDINRGLPSDLWISDVLCFDSR